MRDVETIGQHLIEVRGDTDEITKVRLDIRFKRIRIFPQAGEAGNSKFLSQKTRLLRWLPCEHQIHRREIQSSGAASAG
ncbi:hypothetical protein [Xaviernesmea oryzae]|uniref:hypothetical protein n=1 Tax=Xaviernesmea oryzae TaxID=464029 RepID=UPI00190F02C4|nr:hypothetical protein [Xaviernesmea oryzae]